MTTTATQTRPDITEINAIRIGRCNLLKDISDGKVEVCQLLTEDPGITFMELLNALPRIGKHRASLILESLELGENLKLGPQSTHRQDLRNATPRERQVLADWVSDYLEARAA